MPGRLAENIVHFARVLRAAGLPVGPDRVVTALKALEYAGIEDRSRVHAALSAVLIDRHEHQPVFDGAFNAFWRDPNLFERLMYLTLPQDQKSGSVEQQQRQQRVAEAMAGKPTPVIAADNADANEDEIEIEGALTPSARERLEKADFQSMSAAEFALARKIAETLPLPLPPIVTRRFESSARGGLDLRAILRHSARDPFAAALARRRRQRREAPLVVLIDISGSMERYSRMLLHWVHALTRARSSVSTFTLGTRLTDITRSMKHRDVDEALAAAGNHASDWNGGTRLQTCLAEFNRHHARRVLTGNAAVLLVTDGLEREEGAALGEEAARLRRLAHRVIWLNPLLRYEGFEPRAAGIRAILPHVDAFLPVHNLRSLADLGTSLASIRQARRLAKR